MLKIDNQVALLLEKNIINQIKANILKNSNRIRKSVKVYLDDIVRDVAMKNPTVLALLAGTGGGRDNLRRDLGLVLPEDKVETIIQNIQKAFVLQVKTTSDGILISMRIAYNSLINNLLGNPSAEQEATKIDGSPGKVAYIPWLEWLLEKGGSNRLAPGYYVKKTQPRLRGRSGVIGFMFPTHYAHDKDFTIPRRHQGTPDNNFVTHILFDIEQRLVKDIIPVLERAVSEALQGV